MEAGGAVQGSAWQVRLGPFRTGRGVAGAALRADSTTLALADDRSVSFDGAGRLVRASWEGRSIRRALDNRFVEKRRTGGYPWSHARRVLAGAEWTALVAAILADVRSLRAAVPDVPLPERPGLAERLDAVLSWTSARLAAQAAGFRSVYRPVPILPPDQYRALVLQLTEGCRYNRCAFCSFYRDRAFRVKDPREFSAHVAAARAFFGPGLAFRRGVFLGDANALALPTATLLEAFRSLAAAGLEPLAGGISTFVDAFGGPPTSCAELGALARLGLRRVYLGLESGCDALLAFLDKPATAAEARALVEAVHAAGIAVGVIVLLGAGGVEYAARHVADTAHLLRAMRLGALDRLYLSPLMVGEESPYRVKERAAGIRAAGEEEMDRQARALRAAVTAEPGGGPKVGVYDVLDFLY
jgi:hypothetical protein